MTTIIKNRTFLLVLACFFSLSSSAQTFSPASIDLKSGVKLKPLIESSLSFNDNIYQTPDNNVDSFITILKPSLSLMAERRTSAYRLDYGLESAIYSANSNDNYIDQRFKASFHGEVLEKGVIDFEFSFNKEHEDRGSIFAQRNPLEFAAPFEYENLNYQARYQYGRNSAKASLSSTLRFQSKEYINFEDINAQRDFDRLSHLLNFNYQLGKVSALTADWSLSDTDYKMVPSDKVSRSNFDSHILLGVNWSGLSKTSGKVLAGYQVKNFDSDDRKGFSGAAVDMSMFWMPRSYSRFKVALNLAAKESNFIGDYIDHQQSSVSWQHNWRSDLKSEIAYQEKRQEYVGSLRKDDRKRFSFMVNYDFLRWLTVNSSINYLDNHSTISEIIFDKTLFNFKFVVSL